jgi:hypothetical protein
MHISKQWLAPAFLALMAGSALQAGKSDTCYALNNDTAKNWVLRCPPCDPKKAGVAVRVKQGAFLHGAPGDHGWLIRAGTHVYIMVRADYDLIIPFTLDAPTPLEDAPARLHFLVETRQPSDRTVLTVDKTLELSNNGLLEVGTEESSSSRYVEPLAPKVSSQDSAAAIARALAFSSAGSSSSSSSSSSADLRQSEPFPFLKDEDYSAPESGNRNDPYVKASFVEKGLLICLTFQQPVRQGLVVWLCEVHPTGGRYAYRQPTAVRPLEGNLNEYYFLAPAHRAGLVEFVVKDEEAGWVVGQTSFNYLRDHRMGERKGPPPLADLPDRAQPEVGTEPRQESKEAETKAPMPAKRVRLQPSLPAPPPRVWGLPSDLTHHLVTFAPLSFRSLNHSFFGASYRATRTLEVHGALDDAGLLERLKGIPAIRHIKFYPSKVTEQGLVNALACNQTLESVEFYTTHPLHEKTIMEIIRTHPWLNKLILNDASRLSGEVLEAFADPDALTELRLTCRPDSRLDFSRFTNLARLTVAGGAVTGLAGLTRLSSLDLKHCTEVAPHSLPTCLERLGMASCPTFSGAGDHPLLCSLTLGPDMNADAASAMVRHAPRLTDLTCGFAMVEPLLKTLPTRLTDLCILGGDFAHDADFQYLPGLLRLKLTNFAKASKVRFPPALETLTLEACAFYGAETPLPTSLKALWVDNAAASLKR